MMPTFALVDVKTSLVILFPLPPRRKSVSQPSTTLLFLLAVPLLLECPELLFRQSLATTFGLEAASVMAIGSSIYIEEGCHLAL